MALQPSPDLSSTSINTKMLENDCGAIGIDAYGAVAAFEVSSDVRRDRFFPHVETGIVSTLSSPRILLDSTPSETKDLRPIAGIHTSTVTYFTADRSTSTVTKSDMTIGVTPPTSMTHHLSAMCPSAFRITEHTATKFRTKVRVTRSSEYTATHHLVVLHMLPMYNATTKSMTTKFILPTSVPPTTFLPTTVLPTTVLPTTVLPNTFPTITVLLTTVLYRPPFY